ncbi:MAG: potassium channel family protein [Candidatus Tectomicrobia bacterium]|nr:potassium channel family protein [Candidatus Tectomicrobia bacterium]
MPGRLPAVEPAGSPLAYVFAPYRNRPWIAGGALYFSIMKFTTLGYGDLAPHEKHRLAAAFQAIFGYLFLGLLVAALAVIVIRAVKSVGPNAR